jgi:hypothetical protein
MEPNTTPLAARPVCRVCGNLVNPARDVAFGVAGKVLFVAHAGRCADFIRSTSQSAGKLARLLLEAKQPKLMHNLRQGAQIAQRVIDALMHTPTPD